MQNKRPIYYESGHMFNDIQYIKDVISTKRNRKALFKCFCGKEFICNIQKVKMGIKKNCGCINLTHKHGGYATSEYQIWLKMKHRCTNPNDKNFKHYGGRGIGICDKWLNSFENFISDIGARPSNKHTLDRIDNNGNYEPGNVRWATMKQQANNRRNNAYLTNNGVTQTISQWCEELNLTHSGLNNRLVTLKWTLEEALSTKKYIPKIKEKKVIILKYDESNIKQRNYYLINKKRINDKRRLKKEKNINK